jgi:hypothetical protein
MDVCVRLFCVCILYVGSGLATGWSPVQGVFPNVYKLKLNSVAFSPQANYTERATAACRWR